MFSSRASVNSSAHEVADALNGLGVAAPGSPGGSAQLPRQAKVTYSDVRATTMAVRHCASGHGLCDAQHSHHICHHPTHVCVIDYVLITVINYV
jgi:hypothetical protein